MKIQFDPIQDTVSIIGLTPTQFAGLRAAVIRHAKFSVTAQKMEHDFSNATLEAMKKPTVKCPRCHWEGRDEHVRTENVGSNDTIPVCPKCGEHKLISL